MRAEPRRAADAGDRDASRTLVALASEKRDILMKTALERDVRLVRCEDGQLEIALEPSARQDAGQRSVAQALEWTGRRWMVVVSARAGRADA